MEGITDIHSSFVQVGLELGATTTRACLGLVPMLALGLLVYSMANAVMRRENSLADFSPLIQGLLLVYVLLSYKEMAWMISSLVSALCHTVPLSPGIGEALTEMSQLAPQQPSGSGETDSSVWSMFPAFSDVKNLFNSRRIIVGLLTDNVLFLIRLVMDFIRGAIITFLYIVGPVAITLSLVPWFREVALYWLKGFVGIQLWGLTLRVLDRLAYHFNTHSMHKLEQSGFGMDAQIASDDLSLIAANLLFILMYLMTPSITSYFFNPGAIGSAITNNRALRRIRLIRLR